MVRQSAGILIYRKKNGTAEVLLTHPGGPFWANKDTWSVPKGETDEGEALMTAAKREFKEETGSDPPDGEYKDLGQSKQGDKINYIWAVEGDFDVSRFVCTSTFTVEWPPKSGRQQSFPENDRAQWFSLNEAKKKVYKAQYVFIDRLAEMLEVNIHEDTVPPVQPSLF
jgi:predicted NUDIX family NTP pyrophosphohydrolase